MTQTCSDGYTLLYTIHCPIRTIPSELLLSDAVTPTFISMYIDGHTCIYNDVHDRQFQHVVMSLSIKKEHDCAAGVYTLQFHVRARNELTIPYAPHSAASQ